ncbi:hypothetical protein CPB86DRAFT_818169 [Serendipita vermifera]|nr:hypothetical protein CPB86DRAFT_818169 [Serendipita vermifera]
MPVAGLDHIIVVLTHFRIIDYTIMAGAVAWFYDIFLTLDDELTLLWTRGGGFIKALYLINRYLPTLGLPLILNSTMAYSDTLRSCISVPPKTIGAVYVTPIFIESVVAFATLYHAWLYRHSQTNMQSSSVKTIIHALHVDGFIYYMLVLTMKIGSSLVNWVAPKSLTTLLCWFDYSFTSTITSRWFLSFRKVLTESSNSASYPTMTTTNGGKTAQTTSTDEAFEFRNRRLPHLETFSFTQDLTRPVRSLEAQEKGKVPDL